MYIDICHTLQQTMINTYIDVFITFLISVELTISTWQVNPQVNILTVSLVNVQWKPPFVINDPFVL